MIAPIARVTNNWKTDTRFVAAFLALLTVTLLLGCGKGTEKEAFPPARITATTVEFPYGNPQIEAIQTTVAQPFQQGNERLTGQIVWNEDCTDRVFSSVAGRVERVSVEIGQHVNKGDDLALLRSPDFGQAQADYRKAVGDFAQFDKALARIKALREHGAAAAKDVESAQADFDRAAAEKQRAKARLQLLGGVGGEFNDLYHLTAPISGIVVDKNVNLGQEVRSDMMLANSPQLVAPMFIITDPKKLWVQLDVPERNVGRLQSGQAIALTAAAYPARTFPGIIASIGASLDPQTRVARARATVDNPDNLLKAGMYVSLDVRQFGSSTEEVVLPTRAVLFLEGNYYVFVEKSLGIFEKRQVTLRRDASSDSVVVTEVKQGEHVVTNGDLLLSEMLPESAPTNVAGQTKPNSP